VASLLVVQGSDRGRRFNLAEREPTRLGRDRTNTIRLNDSEVSRRHAEIRKDGPETYRIVDLASANGTYVNGRRVDQAVLRVDDRLHLGGTVIVFEGDATTSADDRTGLVDLLGQGLPENRSAIIRSIPVGDAAIRPAASESTGEWLKVRLSNLAVMYEATRAISHVMDPDELLQQILQLIFDSIGADRGAILLFDEEGHPRPKAVRWRGRETNPEERIQISESIVQHVLNKGEAVITSDASGDRRFSPSQSIVDYGIREAICVPIQGRHSTLGVLYADVRGSTKDLEADPEDPDRPRGRFTYEHLTMMAAIGHQAGLAIENTSFYHQKLEAERLAVVGQTIATVSHHIKNILQGINNGNFLLKTGLDSGNLDQIRQGWAIVDKNQRKIYNLVLDMLSFSKDREPALVESDLNEVVEEVVELMKSRAEELGVELRWHPDPALPTFRIDPDGIHRAVLNIVTNALDATEEREDGARRVTVSTRWEAEGQTARIEVEDNGPGIPEERQATIFRVFASTKGARGTGLGLPVADKIVREHGGRITIDSEIGRGSRFVIRLSSPTPEEREDELEGTLSD